MTASMEKSKSLPTQIILLVDGLKIQLELAAKATTREETLEKLASAKKLAENINELAVDAAAEVGEAHDSGN